MQPWIRLQPLLSGLAIQFKCFFRQNALESYIYQCHVYWYYYNIMVDTVPVFVIFYIES